MIKQAIDDFKTFDEQIEEIVRKQYAIRDDEEIVIDVNVYVKKSDPIRYICLDCVVVKDK